MKTNNDPCHWVFKKNCSFSPRQVGLFYLAQSAFSLLVASFFLWQGIWIVLPFTLLELTVLAIALLIYAKYATDYETISIIEGRLEIHTSSAGRITSFEANSHWAKILPKLTPNKLVGIQYLGQTKEVGKFIHVSKREAFRHQLEQGLRY